MISIIIGLTGNIASGKTTAARHLEKILDDAMLIDVDKVAKDIYCENSAILEEIKECFGSGVFSDDVSIDYRALGHIVFSSAKELEKLNALMFPEIKKRVGELAEKNRDRKNIIIDAAVLFDAGLDKLCDLTILVKAPAAKRKNLLKSRCSLSDFEIAERLKGQNLNIDEAGVDYIIENSGSKSALIKKIEQAIKIKKHMSNPWVKLINK